MELDSVLEQIKAEIRPVVEGLEAEIVEISLKRAGNKLVLRLLADKKDGITLDECALINKRVGNIIEEKSLISERYLLEVSSPGLDRSLKERRDFERVEGKTVNISLLSPVGGKDYISGIVKKADENRVILEDNEAKEVPIAYSIIGKAKLKIEL